MYNLGDKSIIFKYISIKLQNEFDADLIVSDMYNLDLAKCIYRYLRDTIDANNVKCESNLESVSSAYLHDVKLYVDISNYSGVTSTTKIYDRNNISNVNVTDISEINEQNIALWPIDNNVIQYIMGSIISNQSSLEDIALIQNMVSIITSFEYLYTPGHWDPELSDIIFKIQNNLKSKYPKIICSGLCDLYVENYLRSHGEVRITSYGNN